MDESREAHFLEDFRTCLLTNRLMIALKKIVSTVSLSNQISREFALSRIWDNEVNITISISCNSVHGLGFPVTVDIYF